MKKLIVANWKLNPTTAKEAKTLFHLLKKGVKSNVADVVICPPFVYFSLSKGLTLGAQNSYFEEKGAFTGEVSPAMLKDLGIQYVLVGHSERRNYFGETNEIVNEKAKKVLEQGLKVILCLGEKEGENTVEVLKHQLTLACKDIPLEHAKNIIIAYEPVWAIGTGKNCSVADAMQAVSVIRQVLSMLYNQELADSLQIIYGGSVNSSNSGEYLHSGTQGLLVGGASLKAEEFIKIIKSAN
jgi:triosephosphate isomerase